MPGCIFAADPQHVAGWAWHPVYESYHVVVHLAVRGRIISSHVADLAAPADAPPEAAGHWFSIALTDLDPGAAAHEILLLIAETDETIAPYPRWPGQQMPISVEEILGVPAPRAWVSGQTYIDAWLAGLSWRTIVDLMYRDYLGRAADPNGLEFYATGIESGRITPDKFRESLMASEDYRQRRRHVADAPGAIFSKGIVQLAEPAGIEEVAGSATQLDVSADALVALDGEAFVAAAYQQILGKRVDPEGLAHYLNELQRGRGKLDILCGLAGDLGAIARGVVLRHAAQPQPADALQPAMPARPGRGRWHAGAEPRRGWAMHAAPAVPATADGPAAED